MTTMSGQKELDQITEVILKPIRFNWSFKIWMGFLTISLLICLYAYSLQLRDGLGVAGIRDYVSWGMYISNFVFFVAASLIGMLSSAVLGLLGIKWAGPIGRISEIIALAFASVSGIVIVMDMGRPERLLYVFTYARIQSPILWDVTVVITYMAISALLLYLPLIPDIKICHDKVEHAPKFLKKIYKVLSLGWTGTNEQYRIIRKSIQILLVLIIPVALGIHTVTSWLFASTSRTGWDSTIFGPYFVTGAFVSGCSAVIIAMYFFMKSYKLEKFINDNLFDKMGKLLVLVSLVYLYFNINEFLVPAYKLKKFDAIHIREIFLGSYALMFWFVQIFGLILPIIILIFKKARKPLPMLIIALFVFFCAWLKRFIIVVPTQLHPNLPIQNVPEYFKFYTPTLIETAITLASFILVLMIVTILSKIFPVIPINDPLHE
jgi:molybdopterin-containing oxidoreductase family membrane subunit